ncbi:Magnesium and cobalt efflux protein CorC [compost metagenome]
MDPDPAPASFLVTFVFIFFALVLVFLNAFFVAAEFAIVKVRKTRLEELDAQGVPAARIALNCVNHLDEYLSVCQLGITLVSLGLGWIGEQSFYNLLIISFPQPPFPTEIFHLIATGISFFIISMLHVVLGELVPKSMAIQRAEQLTLVLARPLSIFYIASKPLINVFTWMANVLLKWIGFHRSEEDPMSEEELKMVIGDSADGGVISANEAQIIHRAFSFSDKTLKDIMIPVERVQYVSLARTFAENKAVIQSKNHTRFPVCRTDMTSVIGVVNMKDMRFTYEETNETFEKAMRPAKFFPSSEHEDRLMKQFSEKRFHLAIVQDPVTSANVGIVTLEDILEELVGDIVDEHGN